MTNSNFSNYVTGGAFQLSLSRRQIDALSFAKRMGEIWVADGFVGYHAENVLIRKGLLEPTSRKDDNHWKYFKISEEGELVYQLLERAGLIVKTPEPELIPPPEVDFKVDLKEKQELT